MFLSESSTRLLTEDWKETQLEFYQEEQREQDKTRDQKSAGSGAFIISYVSTAQVTVTSCWVQLIMFNTKSRDRGTATLKSLRKESEEPATEDVRKSRGPNTISFILLKTVSSKDRAFEHWLRQLSNQAPAWEIKLVVVKLSRLQLDELRLPQPRECSQCSAAS